MANPELLERAFLAAAIGLLVGIERGWQEREARDGSRVAGIRTFTLIGMLGGVCALLSGSNPLALGLFFLALALPYGFFEWQRARDTGNASVTDFIAGLLTFALGAYAVAGSMALAAAACVAATVMLAERRLLHNFLRQIKWVELRAALFLLVMTAVLLPALPDRPVDPWDALNPHQIWLMTVLVGAVSYAGYIGVRLVGNRAGLMVAAILGGLATSTTVTWTFARLARRDSAAAPGIISAILAAWIVSLIRMTALASAIMPQLLHALAAPILAAVLVLAVPAAIAWRMAGRLPPHGLALSDPFELPLMLRFTLLLTVIMLLAKLVSAARSGAQGLFGLGGLSGLLDVDPITLSMAEMARTGLAAQLAVQTILIAAAANGLAKSVLAVIFGGARLGGILSAAALAAFAAGWIAWAAAG
ncbi:MAG TPA: DUF4010 domain-containing protein [Rhizomicrobium sp.]|nr:DUF4010 domain-containing protein [Rhizomicrobium sp.]